MKNLNAIILLFVANTVSGIAQGISMLAIPWYFSGIIEETSLFGNIYAGVTFISLFWGIYAGTLVDRHNRKNIFLFEAIFGASFLLGISAIGYYLGEVPMPLIAGVFAATFFAYNIHYPALYAFVQEISDPKDYGKITSFLEIQGQLTSVFAGGIGALLLSGHQGGPMEILGTEFNLNFQLEAWSMQKVFLLDGCTYLLSLLLILPITFVPVAKRWNEAVDIRARLNKGVQFLKQNPIIFHFGNAAYFIFVTTMVINYILMPNYVKNYLNAEAGVFAVGEACFAFGAVLSGFLIVRVFSKKLILGIIVCTLISSFTFGVFISDRSFGFFYLGLLLFGLANSGARILRVNFFFKHIPNQYIGRTSSIFQVTNVLLRLFFILLFSLTFFVEHLTYTFVIFCACCFIAASILIYLRPKLINLEVIPLEPETGL